MANKFQDIVMDYDEAYKRLKNHANFPNSGSDNMSLGLAVWHFKQGKRTSSDLEVLFSDVLECLEYVNIELNGAVPSETPGEMKCANVDRWLSLSVSIICNLLLESSADPKAGDFRESLFLMSWRISKAWLLILSGDIDDIEQYVEYEEIGFSTTRKNDDNE